MAVMDVFVGVSTWVFRNDPLEKSLELISRSGAKYIECFANNYHLDPRCGNPDLTRIGGIIEKLGLTPLSIHAPFSRILPSDSLDKMRTHWATITKETIDRAEALHIPSIVIHPFCLTTNERGETKAFNVEDLIIGDMAPYAAQRGITILLENPASIYHYAYQKAKELTDLIPSKALVKMGICLDTCHLVCSGVDPVTEIRNCGSLLDCLHVSDNRSEPKEDRHLPPGEGCIDWGAIFDTLGEIAFSGSLILEIDGGGSPSTALKKSIEFLHRYI